MKDDCRVGKGVWEKERVHELEKQAEGAGGGEDTEKVENNVCRVGR